MTVIRPRTLYPYTTAEGSGSCELGGLRLAPSGQVISPDGKFATGLCPDDPHEEKGHSPKMFWLFVGIRLVYALQYFRINSTFHPPCTPSRRSKLPFVCGRSIPYMLKRV
ncbi:unnamed protein product [Strongylus vulgaris]|uniref:Uncharacterized protein n=1 Tax=Strongylus vulgaris TaxID=40348 RepID=A0A3P7J5R6_STRVU|nr:unnamed protein product [Strongylus vulgaris]